MYLQDCVCRVCDDHSGVDVGLSLNNVFLAKHHSCCCRRSQWTQSHYWTSFGILHVGQCFNSKMNKLTFYMSEYFLQVFLV
jgi:hypothetical protein